VRPDHLEAVTGQVNKLRGTSPSADNARKTHCQHGHAFDEENTYQNENLNQRVCRKCQAEWRRRKRREVGAYDDRMARGWNNHRIKQPDSRVLDGIAGDIRALRIRLGLTQAQFAERLGVHKVSISAWEMGKRRPNEECLAKLARLAAEEAQ
jgi:DNA-binding transcriptional regulator YiaG